MLAPAMAPSIASSSDELSDVSQIAVNLKDSNGNVTPPNLVVVVP